MMTSRTSTQIDVLPHQIEFLKNDYSPELALVGGYGSGKTRALVLKAITMCIANPGYVGLIVEPTDSLIDAVFIPQWAEVCEMMGLRYKYNKSVSDKSITVFLGGGVESTIRLRTATHPARIVGFNCAWAGIDEIDTIPADSAKEVFSMCSARIRTGFTRQLFCVSTPEGFKFLYNHFVKEVEDNPELKSQRRIIKAKTADNPFLPDDYIKNIKSMFDSNRANAYLNGEFVNFASGTVYEKFDRRIHNTKYQLSDYKGRELHVGLDFNFGAMGAVVFAIDESGTPNAIDELVGLKNTEAVIASLKSKYPNYIINIYPDSSGKNNSANSDKSSIDMLRNAGFRVLYKSTNPRIIDRVNTVNYRLNNDGEIGIYINVDKCPNLVNGLEKQGYDKAGMPDKSLGIDHVLDAAGYFIAYKYPITNSTSVRAKIS